MPHYCIVPLCKNVSGMPGISFHRLPLKDPVLLKKWLIKIRRENTPITQHSRVCSVHFKGKKKLDKGDIPEVFVWTKPARPPPKSRQIATSNDIANEGVDNLSLVDDLNCAIFDVNGLAATDTCDSTVAKGCVGIDVDTQTICDVGIDVDTQTIRDVSDVETQICKMTYHVAVQYSPDHDHQSTQTDFSTLGHNDQSTQTDCEVNHVGTMTDGEADIPPFSVEQIKDDDQAVKFYTGFVTFAHMMACFHFLGPAVTNLCYGTKKSDTPANNGGRLRCLSPLNEFFLTMCRLRLSLKEQDLSYRFQISQPTVSRIFNTWISFIFFKFKEVPLWPTREVIDTFMPTCFKSMYPTTKCIVDATEIFIEMPANPSAQQLTFSNYKNRNTLKALIGITPSGAISFISDLYGGNISDKKLTQLSGLLDLLEPGDAIMADRGFTIDDILPSGITLNVPPRMNDSGQLTESERTSTRHIASVRIHVERAMERIKNYQILHHVPNSMHNRINQIFFVCAVLTNFLPPLVT